MKRHMEKDPEYVSGQVRTAIFMHPVKVELEDDVGKSSC